VNDISGWRKEGERGTVKCRFHPRGFSFMATWLLMVSSGIIQKFIIIRV
jgi:hypothetical protein